MKIKIKPEKFIQPKIEVWKDRMGWTWAAEDTCGGLRVSCYDARNRFVGTAVIKGATRPGAFAL